ncbi:hypothetical protein QVD17_20964 [Tagetes erecta]|uniref:Uncharacterized protein n=1 Tax=Tagetes erecta TaxID=13708 RepID=A0AAD8NRH2_TARER|nr:hypothetical protein QVD17_20964 [Tagetes erecta]
MLNRLLCNNSIRRHDCCISQKERKDCRVVTELAFFISNCLCVAKESRLGIGVLYLKAHLLNAHLLLRSEII